MGRPRFKAAVIFSDHGLEATGVTSGDHEFGARVLTDASVEVREFAARMGRRARALAAEDKRAPRGKPLVLVPPSAGEGR